jgi:hypothetical protein
MNTLTRNLVLLSLVLASRNVLATAVDPSSTSVKFYKMAVSTSALCTDMTTVFSSDTGVTADLLQGPTLGSGSLAEGTYPCIAFEISKILDFVPSAGDGGSCVAGTTYHLDICGTNTVDNIDGTQTTCSGGQANPQHVTFYLTTNSTDTIGLHAFSKPTTVGGNGGIKLASALVVSGDVSGTFVVDGRASVGPGVHTVTGGSGNYCDFGPPTFTFR